MSGRSRRRQSSSGPASPAQQEEVGEGELARVLAAVEALTSQVGAISTAVQKQHAQHAQPPASHTDVKLSQFILQTYSGITLKNLVAAIDAPGLFVQNQYKCIRIHYDFTLRAQCLI